MGGCRETGSGIWHDSSLVSELPNLFRSTPFSSAPNLGEYANTWQVVLRRSQPEGFSSLSLSLRFLVGTALLITAIIHMERITRGALYWKTVAQAGPGLCMFCSVH